jgi:hypothetical protein
LTQVLPQTGLTLFCARCARELHPGEGDFFQVTIDAVADPTPPNLDVEPSATELRRRIEELLAQMQDVSAQEALDQVRRHLVLHLCLACFKEWIEDPTGSN